MIETVSARKSHDQAFGCGFLAGALATAVPLIWLIFRGLREAALLVIPFFDSARPVFYVLFLGLAVTTIALCQRAWRQRRDRGLVALEALTSVLLVVTLLAPIWWNPDAFLDHVLSIPMVAFGLYAVFALALSLDWFVRRRSRFTSAA